MRKITPFLWFDDNAEEAAKFYVSWQIVPSGIIEMISDPDAARSDRVMQAVVKMKKLDLAGLKKAYGQPQADTGGYRKKSA